MTNKEKAGIISGKINGFHDARTEEIYSAALQMAEWKDTHPSDELIDTIASITMNYTNVVYCEAMLETIRHLVRLKCKNYGEETK